MTNEKEYKKVSELRVWDKNPRGIKKKDFERLKKQIVDLGAYKPLLATDDGIVIGGNMRLRALMDLGVQNIWVNTITFFEENKKWRAKIDGEVAPKIFESKEQAMLEYALSDVYKDEIRQDADGSKWLKVEAGVETDIWEYNKPSKSKEHPTMKPIGLCARGIKNSTKYGEIVLDSFGGSGSTLIACEQLHRKCRMVELDPKYVDVIRKRYAKFIGEENWEEATPKI